MKKNIEKEVEKIEGRKAFAGTTKEAFFEARREILKKASLERTRVMSGTLGEAVKNVKREYDDFTEDDLQKELGLKGNNIAMWKDVVS